MSKKQELQKLLKHKKSKEWYAAKLGTSIARVEELLTEIRGKDETGGIALEEVNIETGDRKVEYISPRPLSKEEIEDLYGIDGIKSRLANYWNKQTASGKYLVSALIKCTVEDFYSTEELEEKLKEIFPKNIVSIKIPKISSKVGKILNIVISDDHAGAINETFLFSEEGYTKEKYEKRLLSIVEEVVKLGEKFEEVHIISLGDQLNGWSSQTTRGGHEVKSLSNKEQFDFYTSSRVSFYNSLFTSGITDTYIIHEIEDSNHSGLGMSYIANKYLEMYIKSRFPEVKMDSISDMIGGFEWKDKVIFLTHGKDEKFAKRPMPLSIDAKTDVYLYDFANSRGYSPYSKNITLYKGDLHSFSIQNGKFGRYVNCPSLVGNNDYSDINFGNSKAGALLEILEEGSDSITTKLLVL